MEFLNRHEIITMQEKLTDPTNKFHVRYSPEVFSKVCVLYLAAHSKSGYYLKSICMCGQKDAP